MDAIVGSHLKKQDADVPTDDAFNGIDWVAIYFGAHWAPPCRLFTGHLKKFYDEINKDNKKFEVVFVSIDGSEQAFKKNFSEMPWLAINYNDESQVNNIKQRYGVNGIPCLVIVDPKTASLVKYDGRQDIQQMDAETCVKKWEEDKAAQNN